MDLDNLILDALKQPTNVISYHVTKQLRALYAGRYVLFSEACGFDLDDFAGSKHCEATHNPNILNLILTRFRGAEWGLSQSDVQAVYDITWQGKTLTAVFITWLEGWHKSTSMWIVAETQEIADAFYFQVSEWSSEIRGEVLVFDSGMWAKSKPLFDAIKNATFENLVLPARLKQEIKDDFAQFFASRPLYDSYRIPWKRGVLLIGPPGNGKTHTVKALLNWLNIPCLYVKSFKSEGGIDQDNIGSIFERARLTTPCVLVLEDLDSLIDNNNRAFFLNELDGFASNTGIVVLATTNHPEHLDTAIVNRPSRFDRKYHFDLPAAAERENYIRKWSDTQENDLRLSDSDIAEVVALTYDFSFAYLKELFVSALMRWIAHSRAEDMASVMREQCALLREQMSSEKTDSEP